MNNKDKKNKSPLQSLEGRLNIKGGILKKKRRGLRSKDLGVSQAWQKEPEPIQKKEKKPLVTQIFIASLVFFGISLVIALFVFVRGANVVSSENVTIAVSAPSSIEAGKEVTLEIIIENSNVVPLEFTNLFITFPEGTRVAGDIEKELKRLRTSLGTIQPREIKREIIQAVFFGKETSQKEMFIEIEYRVADSNAIFVASEVHTIVISSSPIDLSVTTLKEISSGQELTIKMRVRSNSTEIVEGLLLNIDYPFGFSFINATPQPAYDTTTWNIGDLEPGGERIITVRGILEGQDGEQKVFRVESGAARMDDRRTVGVVYGSSLSLIDIARPFLGLQLSINSSTLEEYSVEGGKSVRAELVWTNNIPTKITNAEIQVRFKGEVLDKSSVFSRDGFYRSIDNTIIWNKDTRPELATIEPGSKGRVTFEFSSLSLFTQGGTIFKSPLIEIEIIAKGERLSEAGVPEEVRNIVTREIKIISDVEFSQRGVYYEGPFTNVGVLPPQVEKETTYTVIWTVVNSSNTLSRATAEVTLPPYVRWMGTVSPTTETVVYDERDRRVRWDLGVVRGGVGITSSPREVAFQITLLPSITHLNQVINLLSRGVFSANDEFANAEVNITTKAIGTNLTTDPQFHPSQARVVELESEDN